eukprot:gene25714-11371_t
MNGKELLLTQLDEAEKDADLALYVLPTSTGLHMQLETPLKPRSCTVLTLGDPRSQPETLNIPGNTQLEEAESDIKLA